MPFRELLAFGAVAYDPELPVDGVAAAIEGLERLFIADFEMSGPNPVVHEVLDVGWVIVDPGAALAEISSWGSRVKPRRIGNAEIGALKVVGYSPKAWREAVELEATVAKLIEEGSGAAFVGWGFNQDLAFVNELLRAAGSAWPFAPVAIDVQRIARQLLSRGETVDRFNLGHVADRLGIGRLGEHGALADAYATFDVLVELAKLHAADLSRPA
jgi:DNA polymerase III alpha subunit (gram-positive type)